MELEVGKRIHISELSETEARSIFGSLVYEAWQNSASLSYPIFQVTSIDRNNKTITWKLIPEERLNLSWLDIESAIKKEFYKSDSWQTSLKRIKKTIGF